MQKISEEPRRNEIHVRISIDAYCPYCPFENDVLDEIRSNSQSQIALDLASKITVYAHTGLTGLTNDEADYLDALYEPLAIDFGNIRRDRSASETMRQYLMEARLGQGRFRLQILERWRRRCAVTGCALEDILRASHIKPWRCSSNDERLDPANGLLLTANLDLLFDRYLISFEQDGRMLISPRIIVSEYELLGIPQNLRSDIPLGETLRFLVDHQRAFIRRYAL